MHMQATQGHFLLESTHKASRTVKPSKKQHFHRNTGLDLPRGLGASPGEVGLDVAHCGGKGIGSGGPRQY